MEPIYRKAYIELDRAEERVKFYSVRRRSAAGRECSLCARRYWCGVALVGAKTHPAYNFPGRRSPAPD